MKAYVLVETSYGETFVNRCYATKEDALKDADFIISQERPLGDDTFRERWIKVGETWYNQCQHASEPNVWPEWADPTEHYSGRLYVQEYDMNELSLCEKFAAVQHWQSCGTIHPLTCGIDSSHPVLVPNLGMMNKEIEIICPFEDTEGNGCQWHQKYDHPVFNIIYAKYISDRSQTT